MVEKYINPHTDFGFKRLFSSEFNKELLISFLNAMFHVEQNVMSRILTQNSLATEFMHAVQSSMFIARTTR